MTLFAAPLGDAANQITLDVVGINQSCLSSSPLLSEDHLRKRGNPMPVERVLRRIVYVHKRVPLSVRLLMGTGLYICLGMGYASWSAPYHMLQASLTFLAFEVPSVPCLFAAERLKRGRRANRER